MDNAGSSIKRSRRVVLTLMGSAAVSTVSMGFVRGDCGPDRRPDAYGRWPTDCPVRYGGFGVAPHRYHAHGHAHGGG